MILDSHSEKPAFPVRIESLSWTDSLIVFLCIAVGTAPSKIGYSFQNGIIFTPIVSACVAGITFYNMVLFIKVGCRFQVFTFEQMWTALFGSRFVFFPAFCSTSTSIFVNMYYIRIIVTCIQDALHLLFSNLDSFVVDYWFLSYITCFLFIIPFILSKNLSFIGKILKLKLVALFLIICFMSLLLFLFFTYS